MPHPAPGPALDAIRSSNPTSPSVGPSRPTAAASIKAAALGTVPTMAIKAQTAKVRDAGAAALPKGLEVTDLSRKAQPAWGQDPHVTKAHLEQNRLFSKGQTSSASAAVRMYERVGKS